MIHESLLGSVRAHMSSPGIKHSRRGTTVPEAARLAGRQLTDADHVVTEPSPEEHTRQRCDLLQSLSQVASGVHGSLDQDTVLRATVDTAVHVLGFDIAVVFLLDEAGEFFRLSKMSGRESALGRVEGLLGHAVTTLDVPASDDVCLAVTNTLGRQTTVSHDLGMMLGPWISGPLCARLQQTVGCDTFLLVPMLTQETLVGGLLAAASTAQQAESGRELLTFLTDQAASALANSRRFQELRQAKNLWEASADAVQDQLFVVDPNHEIVTANKAVADATGLPMKTVLDRKCFQLLHGLHQPTEGCPLPEAQSRIGPVFAEIQDPSGRSCHGHLCAPSGSRGGARSIVESCGEVNDMAQAQNLHQTEVLGEIIAEVVHEVSNPLTVILGYCQLLQAGPLAGEAQDDLQVIERAARRCRHIVQNLLTFSRPREPQRRPVDINQILREAMGLRAYRLHARNIAVALDLLPDLPVTMADPHQLQQLFLVLVNNAEQAMVRAHGRGHLCVRSRIVGYSGLPWGLTESRDAEDSRPQQKAIRLEFIDDGPGISAEAIHRVFDPSSSAEPEGEGTGLGLSSCHDIVREHGGHISVDSLPGHGATFIVELPVIAPVEEDPEPEHGSTTSTPDGPLPASVLVVDDEKWVAGLLDSAMGSHGVLVEAAHDGQQALDRIIQGDYDVILCDIKMPGLSGRELYARLRDAHPRQTEKLVFMTGDMATEETRDFLTGTGRPCLSKPFTLDEVEEIIRSVTQIGAVGS